MIEVIKDFFISVKTFEDGKNFLIENKNFTYNNYTNIQSRKILFSLMIYKFGNEMECPENLKEIARNIILYTLDNEHTQKMIDNEIRKYLKYFIIWKTTDMNNILLELAKSCINLEEMKKSILIKSKENYNEVDEEWLYNIDNLTEKLNTYGNKLDKINYNNILQNIRKQILNEKEQLATNIVKQIYWDKFLNDITNNNYNILYENFEEIKDIFREIEPNINLDILDTDFLKNQIINHDFKDEYLINYINYITDKLLQHGMPIHDKLVKETRDELVKEILQNGISPKIITNTFRKLMDLLQNLITIIRIYRLEINRT